MPKSVLVWYRGVPFRLSLDLCRRALVERQVEGVRAGPGIRGRRRIRALDRVSVDRSTAV